MTTKTKTTKTKVKKVKPDTSRENHADRFMDGVAHGMMLADQSSRRSLPPSIAAGNCDGPKLRLVSNGEEWGVEAFLPQPKRSRGLTETQSQRRLVNISGFFPRVCEYERDIYHRSPIHNWKRLKTAISPTSLFISATEAGLCESEPITFASREAAIAWVRQEFGEAGVRSLKANAEFRPA